MKKSLNTQNECIILTLIGVVAWFCLVSFDVKEKYTNRSHESIMRTKKSILLLFSWTSVVCKLEIKINLSNSKVTLHPYSKSISTTKCVISPLLKINMHHQMWNRAPTPNRDATPARTWIRGLQHVNWVCKPLHHQSLTLSSYSSRQ